MSGFFGGDTGQMRQQAGLCTSGAGRLAQLIEAAASSVEGTEWTGPDAEAFRENWRRNAQRAAQSAGELLEVLARELEEHAEQQDTTSAAEGSFLDTIRDRLSDPRFPLLGPPLLPFPLPMPGLPLGPGVLDLLGEDVGSGTGTPADPYFYGDQGYGVGNAASDGRPVGDQTAGGSHWDGREIDNDLGYADGYANTRASSGGSITTDVHGNTTYSGGARAGADIGFDEMINLPGGASYQTDGRAGAEAYIEGGFTMGPDGVSYGGAAGAGAYADIQGTFSNPDGSSGTIGLSGYAGAEAHLNAYGHTTRNADGEVNGITFGADAGAFAGAKGDLDFAATAPGGWFSGSGSFGVKAGVGGGASFGGTVSTDEFGFAVGGDVAALLGVEGSLGFSIHPNEIVNDIVPGDYDLDDAIDDASGAFDGAKNFVEDNWPF